MSANNGVIRIGRKGLKKFAIGDEDDPRKLPVFEVDVVVAFQQWIIIDDNFRPTEEDAEGNRRIPTADMPAYYAAAQAFVMELINTGSSAPFVLKPDMGVTVGEALDFIARLREQYDELAVFFRPKLQDEQNSPDTSEAPSGMRFSVEEEAS